MLNLIFNIAQCPECIAIWTLLRQSFLSGMRVLPCQGTGILAQFVNRKPHFEQKNDPISQLSSQESLDWPNGSVHKSKKEDITTAQELALLKGYWIKNEPMRGSEFSRFVVRRSYSLE